MLHLIFLGESQQTSLLIAAFILALLALLWIIVALIFLCVATKCKYGALTSNQALPLWFEANGALYSIGILRGACAHIVHNVHVHNSVKAARWLFWSSIVQYTMLYNC